MKRRLTELLEQVEIGESDMEAGTGLPEKRARSDANALRAELDGGGGSGSGGTFGLREGQNVLKIDDIEKHELRYPKPRSDGRLWTAKDKANESYQQQHWKNDWMTEMAIRKAIVARHPSRRFLAMYQQQTNKPEEAAYDQGSLTSMVRRELERRMERRLDQQRRIVGIDQKKVQVTELDKAIGQMNQRLANILAPMNAINPVLPGLRQFFDMDIGGAEDKYIQQAKDMLRASDKLAHTLVAFLARVELMTLLEAAASGAPDRRPANVEMRKYCQHFFGTKKEFSDENLADFFIAGGLLFLTDAKHGSASNRTLAVTHIHLAAEHFSLGRSIRRANGEPSAEPPEHISLRKLLSGATAFRGHTLKPAEFSSLRDAFMADAGDTKADPGQEQSEHAVALRAAFSRVEASPIMEVDAPAPEPDAATFLAALYKHTSPKPTVTVEMMKAQYGDHKNMYTNVTSDAKVRGELASMARTLFATLPSATKKNKEFELKWGWLSAQVMRDVEHIVAVSLSHYLTSCYYYLHFRNVLDLGIPEDLFGSNRGAAAAAERYRSNTTDGDKFMIFRLSSGMEDQEATLKQLRIKAGLASLQSGPVEDLVTTHIRAAFLHHLCVHQYKKDQEEATTLRRAIDNMERDRDELGALIGSIAAERPTLHEMRHKGTAREADEEAFEETLEWSQQVAINGFMIVHPSVVAALDIARSDLGLYVPRLRDIPLEVLTTHFDSGLPQLFVQWAALMQLKVELGFASQMNRTETYKEYKRRFSELCTQLSRFSYSSYGSSVSVTRDGKTFPPIRLGDTSKDETATSFLL